MNEDIDNLEINSDMKKFTDVTIKGCSDIMTIYFNMFCPLLKNKVGCNLNDANIVCMKSSNSILWKAKFFK